jgi:hypothetical protein
MICNESVRLAPTFCLSHIAAAQNSVYRTPAADCKTQEAQSIQYNFQTEKSYADFMDRHSSELMCSQSEIVALTMEELADGGVHRFVGPLYTAMLSDHARRAVDIKVLELEAALAVQTHLCTER